MGKVDLEEAVLGAMMMIDKGVDVMIYYPEAFIKRHTNIFFEAIVQLFTEAIDLLTVSAQLKKTQN
jgi:replicative DNA helicase